MKGPLFYSKILLFGEYGIIQDSKGLSIPYNFYNGALKSDENPTEEAKKSNESLVKFVAYLKQLQTEQPELVTFNIEVLQNDVNNGMYFDSSIPQGYGVGSSGALVAAIYDKYATNKITVLENLTREKLLQLKAIFSNMESFFHGKSSGLDPLNSYLSLPILINSKDNIEAAGVFNSCDAGTTMHCTYNPETREYTIDYTYYIIDFYDFSFFDIIFEEDAYGLAKSYEIYGCYDGKYSWKKEMSHSFANEN